MKYVSVMFINFASLTIIEISLHSVAYPEWKGGPPQTCERFQNF